MSAFDDERSMTRRYHRMAALDAMELAELERERDERDWSLINYLQRDAQIHALLAVSAGDA